MGELLRAQEVCAGYGRENVLQKVSFSVQTGSCAPCWGATARANPPCCGVCAACFPSGAA